MKFDEFVNYANSTNDFKMTKEYEEICKKIDFYIRNAIIMRQKNVLVNFKDIPLKEKEINVIKEDYTKIFESFDVIKTPYETNIVLKFNLSDIYKESNVNI